MSKEHKFLTMFDSQGFECIIDITSHERAALMSNIRNEEVKTTLPLHQMMTRARSNPQRSPEIWVFTATDLTAETLEQFAEESPQALVDLIRQNGKVLFQTVKGNQVIH